MQRRAPGWFVAQHVGKSSRCIATSTVVVLSHQELCVSVLEYVYAEFNYSVDGSGAMMGATYATMKVEGARGKVELQALADTGATFTKIPRSYAEKIGLETEFETVVQVSTGAVVPRSVGYAKVDVEGVKRRVPIAIGEETEPAILGYTALEILELKVNPITRRLEKAMPIEY